MLETSSLYLVCRVLLLKIYNNYIKGHHLEQIRNIPMYPIEDMFQHLLYKSKSTVNCCI